MTTPLPRTDLAPIELKMLRALAACTFLPGSFDKRFVRDIQGQTALTEKQRDLHNLDICAEAAARYRGGGFDVVKIECFNETEADRLTEIMARLYPDVPCVCTFRFPRAEPVSPNGENAS